MNGLTVTIVVDNPQSWVVRYAKCLRIDLMYLHDPIVVFNHEDIRAGDVAVFLSCEKIASKETLAKNKSNIVIHASNLPQGRGWSPLTWQILEGKNDIPITLFEIGETVDSGPIYLQETLHFKGHELLEEMQQEMGFLMQRMVANYLDLYPMQGKEQTGDPTYYTRRNPMDSYVNYYGLFSSTFDFNKLRVADNERYPLFFVKDGVKYILKIYKE